MGLAKLNMDLLQDLRGRVSVIADHLDFGPALVVDLPEPPVELPVPTAIDEALNICLGFTSNIWWSS